MDSLAAKMNAQPDPGAHTRDACRHYASGISRPYETLLDFRREANDLRAMCEPSFRGF